MLTISQIFMPTSCFPLKTTLPEFGFNIPVRSRSRVVLPAPLGPMRPMISFCSMRSLIFLTACRPPKFLFNPSTSSNGTVMSALLVFLSQFPPRDLADIGFRQLAAEFDDLRNLVMGKPLTTKIYDFFLRNLASGLAFQNYIGLDQVSDCGIRNTDNAGGLDLWMLIEDFLHMPREY